MESCSKILCIQFNGSLVWLEDNSLLPVLIHTYTGADGNFIDSALVIHAGILPGPLASDCGCSKLQQTFFHLTSQQRVNSYVL